MDGIADWLQHAEDALRQGQLPEAATYYQHCIELQPETVSYYWRLGLALFLQGEELEAEAVWLTVLASDAADDADTVNRWTAELIDVLAQAARMQTSLSQQERLYRQILQLDPNYDAGWHHLAQVLFQQGRLEEAIACFQEILERHPHDPALYNNLGVVLEYQGNVEAAIACYQKVVAIDPDNFQAYFNLGHAFEQHHQIESAIACYQQVIHLNPSHLPARYNLGLLLDRQGQLEAAIACYRQLLALDPNNSRAHNYLGFVLHQQGALSEAIACYQAALALNPDDAEAHWNYSLLLLQQGDLAQGFAEFEWRWHLPDLAPSPFAQPLWDGSDLTGKTILLHSEYGFGDTIQFVRYVPLVQARGGRVILQCQPSLLRLLQTVAGIDQLISSEADLPPFDVHAPLMSLPAILGTTLATIPNQIPYLQAPDEFQLDLPSARVEPMGFNRQPLPDGALAPHSSPRLNIGIVWAGNPQYKRDRSRSSALSFFLPLFQVPGLAFYSLQKGDRERDLAELSQVSLKAQDQRIAPIYNLAPYLTDFADTAAAIAQLDLVITTDTAVAHLAGALGRPVWLLLSCLPDWRWLLDRDDSPWYPTMRLFRQRSHGDWVGVLADVKQALQAFQ